jgi:(p)ppGpp synthase/HD superfamily hydrolase
MLDGHSLRLRRIEIDVDHQRVRLRCLLGCADAVPVEHIAHGFEADNDIPYVAHLLAVCATVLEWGGDEDVAIAALLHDAVEDQGGLPTLKAIEEKFGARVARIVATCTDSTSSDPTAKPDWEVRKRAHIAKLATVDADVALVTAADKLHNLEGDH